MKKSEIVLFFGVACGLITGSLLLQTDFLHAAGGAILSFVLFSAAFQMQKKGR